MYQLQSIYEFILKLEWVRREQRDSLWVTSAYEHNAEVMQGVGAERRGVGAGRQEGGSWETRWWELGDEMVGAGRTNSLGRFREGRVGDERQYPPPLLYIHRYTDTGSNCTQCTGINRSIRLKITTARCHLSTLTSSSKLYSYL